MEIKYEPVFGDQSLFDGASKLTVAIRAVPYSAKNIEVTMTQLIGLDVVNYQQYPVIAMRRIIAEPKRWTVEDQEAWRLPDVGAKVDGGKVVFVNGFNVVTELKSGAVIVSSPKTFLNIFKPIETPEEKAQREEDAFVDSLKSVEIHDGTVSGFFSQGARAAYRKLKGGE